MPKLYFYPAEKGVTFFVESGKTVPNAAETIDVTLTAVTRNLIPNKRGQLLLNKSKKLGDFIENDSKVKTRVTKVSLEGIDILPKDILTILEKQKKSECLTAAHAAAGKHYFTLKNVELNDRNYKEIVFFRKSTKDSFFHDTIGYDFDALSHKAKASFIAEQPMHSPIDPNLPAPPLGSTPGKPVPSSPIDPRAPVPGKPVPNSKSPGNAGTAKLLQFLNKYLDIRKSFGSRVKRFISKWLRIGTRHARMTNAKDLADALESKNPAKVTPALLDRFEKTIKQKQPGLSGAFLKADNLKDVKAEFDTLRSNNLTPPPKV